MAVLQPATCFIDISLNTDSRLLHISDTNVLKLPVSKAHYNSRQVMSKSSEFVSVNNV